jgi:biopolymer transport protein ExbB
VDENLVVQYFQKGGWIMFPILATSIVALAVIVERTLWWAMEARKRDEEKLNKVYAALEKGDLAVASGVARNSEDDPILRVIWHGLNHHYASLEGALQVAAGIEIERAGRFLVVMDTIVTLAPLLGLLGTVTGLMKAFFKLGNSELSEGAITGGIAEALIATACGLTIAVVCLIALNYFSARVAKFTFQLQNACTNTEILINTAKAKTKGALENETHFAITA